MVLLRQRAADASSAADPWIFEKRYVWDGRPFLLSGRQKDDDGVWWADLAEDTDDEEDGRLPEIRSGEHVDRESIDVSEHSTEPPPRYSEASLIKRMEELESIAREHNGVQQAYAIQAGRELRVIISSEKADDESAAKVARAIAKQFEEQLTYPGEIKVTVIRESRFTEFAR